MSSQIPDNKTLGFWLNVIFIGIPKLIQLCVVLLFTVPYYALTDEGGGW